MGVTSRPLLALTLLWGLGGCDDGDFRLKRSRPQPPQVADPAESLVSAALSGGQRPAADAAAPTAAAKDEPDGGGPRREVLGAPGERTPFVRSGRCGECHEALYSDWQLSAHSRAARSPHYLRALQALDAAEQAGCRTCHAPGHDYGQPDAPGRPSEGVSCDSCHTLLQVEVSARGARMTHRPESGAKYGPIVGATGHYFHDMAYSELHRRSEVCAGCHHALSYAAPAAPGQPPITRDVPVVADYSGWQRYGRDRDCQDCHMPSRGTMPVARGSQPRPAVPGHKFPGFEGSAQKIKLDASVDRREELLTVDISHRAGHPLPGGHPDQRLLLRVAFQSEEGKALAQEERAFGLVLVDASGKPAPFFRAAKVGEDRRLLPGGKGRRETFAIPRSAAAPGSRALVTLLVAPTAPELAAIYGPPRLFPIKTVTQALHRRAAPSPQKGDTEAEGPVPADKTQAGE